MLLRRRLRKSLGAGRNDSCPFFITEQEDNRMEEEIKRIIRECDLAIKREDFDTLLSHYTEDAVLVDKARPCCKREKEDTRRIRRNCEVF